MKIAIHQPNYLPYAGFFYKMSKADIFVILDDVQYVRRQFQNRCIIANNIRLTVPVTTQGRFFQNINEVKIAGDYKKHIKTIYHCYNKYPHFDHLYPDLEKIYKKKWTYLADLNIELISLLKEKIKIKTQIEISSNYGFKGKETDRLVNICEYFKYTTYISGIGAKKYQDERKFKNLEYSDYKGNFLSIIDWIFKLGDKTLEKINASSSNTAEVELPPI